MFTVRLATAPDKFPGSLYIDIEGPTPIKIAIPMPPPGMVTTLPLFTAPAATFTLKLGYILDAVRVGVVITGLGDGDAISIFASRLDKMPPVRLKKPSQDVSQPPHQPLLDRPGVLYQGQAFHGVLREEPCSVKCEHGNPEVGECCTICRNGDVIAETCC